MKTKKLRLRGWVKVMLGFIAGAIVGIAVYQLFTVETVHDTPAGSYTCNGGLVKVCSGSQEVADYLGV